MTIISDQAPGAQPADDRGKEVRASVVLDTSVLVADATAPRSFPGTDVRIPLTVLEELDELKSRPDDVGAAARSAVRVLEELREGAGGDLSSPIDDGAGGTVAIHLDGEHTGRLRELHLSERRPDNRILASALSLSQHRPAMLVTCDASMRVKAAALGLVAREYLRPDHADLVDGTAAIIDCAPTAVDAVYQHGHLLLDELSGALDGAAQNAPVVLRAGSSSVLCRRAGDRLVRLREPATAWGLHPRSKEQSFALDALLDPSVEVVSMSGHAGTGKTLLALAAGLEQVFEPASARYDRLMILRPVVAVGRQELGFLPGDIDQKLGPWFEAVVDAVVALGVDVTHRAAKVMIDNWVADGKLTLEAVTYLRGRSLQRTYVIVDECQNLEPQVAKTVLTRLGKGSKCVLVGDVTQVDSPFLSEQTNALAHVAGAFADSPLFAHFRLTRGERSAVADLAASRL